MSTLGVKNDEHQDSVSPSLSKQVQKSTSGVQSTEDNSSHSQSARSSRRAVASSSEATPIKHSNSHQHRSYNTSDTSLSSPNSQRIAANISASQQTDSSDITKTDTGLPWFKRMAEKYGSKTLENKASVARDHLALERTFLAWLRTSLSFASIGIAVTQLFRLNSSMSNDVSSRNFSLNADGKKGTSAVPFSPFIGHAIPIDILPYLQHAATTGNPRESLPTLGPTLLDQILMLSPDGTPVHTGAFLTTQSHGLASSRLRHVGKPLGATFIGVSVIVLFVGFQRYFEAQHWIIHGKFPASRGSISLVTFMASALIVASLVIILVISPHSYES